MLDEARRTWYVEQAQALGARAAGWMEIVVWNDFAYAFARLAAHFGRLALGQTLVMDVTAIEVVTAAQGKVLSAMSQAVRVRLTEQR